MSGKLMTLFIIGVLIVSMPMSLRSQSGSQGAAAQENDGEFSCPMHADVKSKTPGICPKCGMVLTRAHAVATSAPQPSRWRGNYFPNVPLTTQDGATVHFYDDLLKDKIVVINLIYTQCKDLCPLETARLAQVHKMLGDRMGKDIFFYSISLDPEHDTPEVLKAYAEKFHAGTGWLFLTGRQEDIALISKKLGLYTDPNPNNRDGHRPSVLVGNEATGAWMLNAALDNPRFLATIIGDWLNSWKIRKPMKSYADAPQIAYDKGAYLFQTRCAACHTVGKGDAVGPDLLGVTAQRDRAWLARWLSVPDKMLDEGDPTAVALFTKYKQIRMPNLRLELDEIDALIAFMESASRRSSARAGAIPATPYQP